MLHEQLKTKIKDTVKKIYDIEVEDVEIEHPDNPEFGDFSTNIAFKLAPQLKQSPLEIAKKIAYEINENPMQMSKGNKKIRIVQDTEALQPGFINFHLSEDWLLLLLEEVSSKGDNYGSSDFWKDSKVIVEYTDPNPFKVFHIGHLMTNTIGESMARIFEFLGADVKRANYQGDVGMHVAKSLWGLAKNLEDENKTIEDLEKLDLKERISYLGTSYARGATAFKEEESAVEEINAINVCIFWIAQKMNEKNDGLKPVLDYETLIPREKVPFELNLLDQLYVAGRAWSLDYFETLYKRLGTSFDYYYFESGVAEKGYEFVKNNISNGIFIEDDGAVIYRGEQEGLHTRVFINSFGLPVYEAKDLGLAFIKHEDYKYDKSYIITANEIDTYFEVVLSAMSKINPDLAAKTTHLGHGIMKFKEGKMSSRTGKIVGGAELLNDLRDYIVKKMQESDNTAVSEGSEAEIADKVSVASIKYNILKSTVGSDIIYDKDDVLSLSGNTGSYLLYTYARTHSVLEKADASAEEIPHAVTLNKHESDVLRHLYKLEEVVVAASERNSPSVIASFAFDLAQKYNTLYAELPIIKADSADARALRLSITVAVGQVLKNSLNLLGIKVVDRM